MEGIQKRDIHVEECRVCNGPGTGIHYGVYTCDACKGFFHRSLRFRSSYKCMEDRSCLVQYGKGIICRWCRFKKCLAVGMAKEAIKIGRYASRGTNEVILETKRPKTAKRWYLNSQVKQDNSLATTSDFRYHSDETNTGLRSSQFDEIELSTLSASFSIQEKCINSSAVSLSPVTERSHCPGHTARLSYSAHSSSSRSDLSDCGSFQNNPSPLDSPFFSSSLPTSSNGKTLVNRLYNGPKSNVTKEYIMELYADKDAVMKTLLEANLSAFSYIYDTWSLEALKEETRKHYDSCKVRSELFGQLNRLSEDEYDSLSMETDLGVDLPPEYVAKFFGDSETFLRRMIQYIQKIPGFNSLNMDDKIKLIKNGRYEFNLIMIHQHCNTDLGVIRYSNDGYVCRRDIKDTDLRHVFEDHFEGCKKLQALDLRIEERVVLLALSIMAPDRVELTENEKVNEIFWNLAQILLDLLGKRLDKPNFIFAKLVDISTGFRDCEVKTKLWLRKNYSHPYILQESPLTKEIITD